MNELVTTTIRELERKLGWDARISVSKRWCSVGGEVTIGFQVVAVSKDGAITTGCGRTIEEAAAACLEIFPKLNWPAEYDANEA